MKGGRWWVAILAVTIAVAAFVFFRLGRPEEDYRVEGAIYYRGPMKAKGSNVYGNEDGSLAQPPKKSSGPQGPNSHS